LALFNCAIIFLENHRSGRLEPPSSSLFGFIKNKRTRTFDDTDDKELNSISPMMEEDLVAEEVLEQAEIDQAEDDLRKELFGELSTEDDKPLEIKPKKEAKPKPIILTPEFVPPTLDLLNLVSGKPGAGDSKSKMETIKRTPAKCYQKEVTVGPTVTNSPKASSVNLSR
jgi:hypothetical protein